MNRKVMVFGVFDGIHEGHRSLFGEAKRRGDFLIVAVAQDAVVEKLKGRPPRTSFPARSAALEKEDLVDLVVPGDAVLGRWDVIAEHGPDVIVLGYDQEQMKESIDRYLRISGRKSAIVVAEALHPETLHSSILFG